MFFSAPSFFCCYRIVAITLTATMKRLKAMEARPVTFPQVQPLLSPAVPQPGTQTQFQWGESLPLDPVPDSDPELNPQEKVKSVQEAAQNKQKRSLKIATWNVRRGLVIRENDST